MNKEKELHEKARAFMARHPEFGPEMSLDEWLYEHWDELPSTVYAEGEDILLELYDLEYKEA